MIKQKLHKKISLALLLIFAFPLIFQPAHYFIIHHDKPVSHHTVRLGEYHEHIVCSIDDFQLTEIISDRLDKNLHKQYFNAFINFVYKTPFFKNILNHLFLLRAPPC